MRWKGYDLKRLKIAGLGLVPTLVVGIALAGNAAAAPLWLLCLEGKEKEAPTKYTSDQCLEAAGSNAGKWELAGLSSGRTDTVKIEGFTVRLTDSEAGPLKEKSTIVCNGTKGSGVIEGPGTLVIKGVVVENATKNCSVVSGPCKEVESVEGVNLPWKGEMYETEKAIQTKVESEGSGQPGWAVKCSTMLGGKTDTCTYEEGRPELLSLRALRSRGENLITNALLRRRRAKCSEASKGETGEIETEGAISLSSGNGLITAPT